MTAGRYKPKPKHNIHSTFLLEWYLRVLIAVKRYHDYGNFYTVKYLIEVAYIQFKKFNSSSLWRECGSMQADMVLSNLESYILKAVGS